MPDVDAVVAWASAADGVVGLVRMGSGSREGLATAAPDVDLLVITSTSVVPPVIAGVDLAVVPLDELLAPKLPAEDFVAWYLRSTWTAVDVLVDRSGGELELGIRRQAALTEAEAAVVVPEQLDGFLNLAVRAAKQWRAGRAEGARLDAVESLAWALTTVFALERRVRPYNGYLRWELARHPLVSPAFTGMALADAVDAVASGGGAPELAALARLLLGEARAAGHGELIDSWGERVGLLVEG